MKVVNKLFYYIHQSLVWIAKIMLVAMVLIVTVQVFCRKLLGFSIRWSEEVPLILMVWFGIISMAMGVKEKLHISIEVFFRMMPKQVQFVLQKLVYLLVGLFGFCMLYYGYQLVGHTMKSTMAATKMPTGYLYMVLPFSGVLIIYDSFMDLFGLEKYDPKKEEEGELNA